MFKKGLFPPNKFVFALFGVFFFILCLFALFELGFLFCVSCVPRRAVLCFWLGYRALMKAFQANMLIFFCLPWGSTRPDNVTEVSANRRVENTAAFVASLIHALYLGLSSTPQLRPPFVNLPLHIFNLPQLYLLAAFQAVLYLCFSAAFPSFSNLLHSARRLSSFVVTVRVKSCDK